LAREVGLGKVLAAAPVVGSRSGVAIVAVVAALSTSATAHARGYGLDGQLWVEGEGTYMPNATGAPSFDASNVAVPGRTQPVSGSTGPFGSSMGFFGVRGGLDLVSQGRFIIPLIDIGFYGILGAYADTYTDAGGAPFRLHPAGSMMFDVELLGFGVRFKHRRWMFEGTVKPGVALFVMPAAVYGAQGWTDIDPLTGVSPTLRASLSLCRRLDPVDRLCASVTPNIYQWGWGNGGSVSLRWEFGS
jgi:hypothetical protein